jgi:hypothetical protein
MKLIVYEKSLSVELHLLHKIGHTMSIVAMCDGWLWYSIAIESPQMPYVVTRDGQLLC